ncbi:mitochondrial hypoxia responsive domain containing protein [Cordyceps fumosorosea ARSEF 2679]|uniref:Mitochondrial hypoxia responsive domain containing protein n=1 Tax=Cordyceps fumosorosea (strain ARSEF 2679) TaxID=1081104 RepID=A0A167UFH2_CORFA|nr:mitochondrial hypoxia responsive domain containing protein [Cordyceps fumosorosea ARSEF 2679]OAA61533.1 mitochondrial hypoxia responsive domain containing protein [Cordyceps fumosorosea ARSEF 2679]
MKILSKEEEAAHYKVVVKSGLVGGTAGLAIGLGGVVLASRRYHAFRSLTLPFRSFLVTSSATFCAIVNADRESTRFQRSQDPMFGYQDRSQRAAQIARDNETTYQRFMAWGKENRYSIVFTSWLASMALAMAIVGRAPISTAQKLVQARVYAQGLTLAVLIVSAAFEVNDAKEGRGRWETVMVLDPNDPEHKHLIEKRVHKEEYEGQDLWMDMVEAEEKRIAERKANKAAGKDAEPSEQTPEKSDKTEQPEKADAKA